jgi:hypothetical protein
MAATLVTGFDIEAIRKMEFVFIGTVRARSWNPMACRKASLPPFAIAMTVPGTKPSDGEKDSKRC